MNDKQTVTQQDSSLVEVESFTAQSSSFRKAAWPVPRPNGPAPAT